MRHQINSSALFSKYFSTITRIIKFEMSYTDATFNNKFAYSHVLLGQKSKGSDSLDLRRNRQTTLIYIHHAKRIAFEITVSV